jgi:hypothetical protein
VIRAIAGEWGKPSDQHYGSNPDLSERVTKGRDDGIKMGGISEGRSPELRGTAAVFFLLVICPVASGFIDGSGAVLCQRDFAVPGKLRRRV